MARTAVYAMVMAAAFLANPALNCTKPLLGHDAEVVIRAAERATPLPAPPAPKQRRWRLKPRRKNAPPADAAGLPQQG